MINILIADDNIFFAKQLMNCININREVKVLCIAMTGSEALERLNDADDIDIFVLDLKMPVYNGLEVLEKINKDKKEKYKHSCIVLSGEIEYIQRLRENDMVIRCLYKGMEFNEIISKIMEEVKNKIQEKKSENFKNAIINQITYIGYNRAHLGTKYLIDVIHFMLLNKDYECDNLKKYIYPYIAIKNNTSVHNVKNNIERATNAMYYNCEHMRLKKYFNLQDEYKPNIKTIIYTILDKISC